MRGRVVADGSEALLPVRVFDPGLGGGHADIEAVIDTGFTGHLTLPMGMVSSPSLPELGSEEMVLADGRTVPALAVWDDPLLGMALLAGSRLQVDAVPGGAVVIEER